MGMSQTSRLIAENNRLNEICIYWENEHDKLLDENKKLKKEKATVYKWGYSLEKDYKLLKEENEYLKQQNTQLKQKINSQSKLIERLITIITDEHYN